MKFDFNELPLRDFALLGLSKKDILSLPPETKGSLLNGGRTSFMRFKNIPSKDGRNYYLDARMSLERNNRGEVKLKMHPRQPELKNRFGLSHEEQKYLSENPEDFVNKSVPSEGDKKLSVYYDSLTNEYIAINNGKISPPQAVNGETLTQEQKAKFKQGQRIEVGNSKIGLNPANETGIEGTGIRTIDFDRYTYSRDEKFFDMTLFATGFGNIILLEHLLRLAMLAWKKQPHNRRLVHNQQVNKALANAHEEILALKKQRHAKQRELKPYDISSIIYNNLVQEGEADITPEDALNQKPDLSAGTTDSADKSPENKNGNALQNQSGIAYNEILSLNTTGLDGNLKKAVTDAQERLKEFSQSGVSVPDWTAIKILSHQLIKNGVDTSDINLLPGKLHESLKSIQTKQELGKNNPKNKM